MKKVFIVSLLLAALSFCVNAQTIISNDYSTNTPSSYSYSANNDFEEDLDSTESVFSFVYQNFDGYSNYGFGDQWMTPGAIGFEFFCRASFESHGNYNIDLAPNYSFKLVRNSDLAAYLVLAAGPSFRMQDKVEIDDDWNINYKLGFFVDCTINPRLVIRYDHIVASVGYYYWAPKFKFGKDNGIGGVSVSLGWAIF